MQAFDTVIETLGEAAVIAPLEKMYRDPDYKVARRRMAALKSARLAQTVQTFEQRVLDPGELEMRLDCVIPLDQFIHEVVHNGEDYWENDDNMTDFRRYNKRFVFADPKRPNFTGWRGKAQAAKQSGIVLTDHRGNAA